MRAGAVVTVGLLGVLGLACAGKGGPSVNEEWLARLEPEERRDLDAERDAVRQAEDQVVRAAVEQQDMERQRDIARTQLEASQKVVDAARQAVGAAEATGQRSEVDRAKAELREAQQQQRLHQAAVDFEEARVEAAKARTEAARARTDRMNAELETARLEALQEAGDIRVEELDEGEFRRAVNDASLKETESQQAVRRAQEEVSQAHSELERIRSEVEE